MKLVEKTNCAPYCWMVHVPRETRWDFGRMVEIQMWCDTHVRDQDCLPIVAGWLFRNQQDAIACMLTWG